MSSILTGAIIGGVAGLVTVLVTYYLKDQNYKKVRQSITQPVDYIAAYHYSSFKRFKKSFKFFDSVGALYIIGKTVYYKSSKMDEPFSFNMKECTAEQEPDWRMLKWFSISTPVGEKYYFNSQKMGAFKNDSSETLRGLAAVKTAMNS